MTSVSHNIYTRVTLLRRERKDSISNDKESITSRSILPLAARRDNLLAPDIITATFFRWELGDVRHLSICPPVNKFDP
ncbi:hypothetical protein NPIL_465721 [Nephila pilipes]|uniref:Uncharacterized protein n=1 Tax=Nephila pilipes TaxID=299642 RepID=A0A8X6U055_NEPPI|nr:hypothetical protein NPIL_465721 [Nephila pilipes]